MDQVKKNTELRIGNGSAMSSGGLRGRIYQTTRSLRAGQVARITYYTRHYL